MTMYNKIALAIAKIQSDALQEIRRAWVKPYLLCLALIPIVVVSLFAWYASLPEVQKCREFLNVSRDVEAHTGALTAVRMREVRFQWNSRKGDYGYCTFAVKGVRKSTRMRVDWEGSASGYDFQVIKVSEVDSWGKEIAVVWSLTGGKT